MNKLMLKSKSILRQNISSNAAIIFIISQSLTTFKNGI